MKFWSVVLALAHFLSVAHAELKWDRQRVELTSGPTDPFVDATFGFVNAGKGSVTIVKEKRP